MTVAVKKSQPLGFGFDQEQTEHCFIVTVPISKAKDAKVLISEHFHWIKPEKGQETSPTFNDVDAQLKAVLNRHTWEQIEEHVKAEFNRRLRNLGVKTGQWLKKGQIPVDRTLGKELRDIEITKIPSILFSCCKNGGFTYEDNNFGTQWCVYRNGGLNFAFAENLGSGA